MTDLNTQVPLQQSIDWFYSIIHWQFDFIDFTVCDDLLLSDVLCRWLYSNHLSGSIPSSIGSLTSLNSLYAMSDYYLTLDAGGCTQIN